MAWVDSMRLRRRADKLRAVGWINLVITVIVSVLHASEGLAVLALACAWAAIVMGVTHGAAWMIDKHADRVVRH